MKILILISLLAGAFTNVTAQEVDSEVKKYARCYGQFVRERVPANDARLSAIRAHNMTGIQACDELLREAQFTNGFLESNNQTYSDVALKVLRTFHHFHSSWFGTNNGFENLFVQWEFFDHDEAALYYTKALFDRNFGLSNVLTANVALKGRRISANQGVSQFGFGISWMTFNGFYLESMTNNPVYRVEKGQLVGITPFSGNVDLIVNTSAVPDDINPVPYRHLGGGILGGNGYAIRSMDIDKSTRYDHGVNVNRRWSRKVFNDFLCRDIPVVRISDATPEVLPSSSPTELSFRRSAVCMQCHSSMDPMARVIRNRAIFTSGMANSTGVFRHPNLTQAMNEIRTQVPGFNVDDHRNAYMDQSTYTSRNTRYLPTLGVFRFRTMEGQLVEENIDSLEDLGNAIVLTPDFYACTAKRYLHFLTGIKVEIDDPVNITRNSVQNQHYAFVLHLANDLRNHQNPMRTVMDIVSSPYYMNPYYLE